ncbi:MAG TPA: TonB family protein, partial [Xanthobacteraceae bacterium]
MRAISVSSSRLTAGAAICACACAALAMTACTFTPPPGVVAARAAAAPAAPSPTLNEYKARIAQRIFERNPSLVLHGTPQAMLRSFVLVSFTVDRGGRLVASSVYRTNGDDEAEATALASLRRAAPLPAPPTRLLNGNGQLELFEGWMFNDNGQFQLQTSHSPQA